MSKAGSSNIKVKTRISDALKESAEFFQEPFFLIDTDSAISWGNKHWQKFDNVQNRQSRLTFPLITFMQQSDQERLLKLWTSAIASRTAFSAEVRMREEGAKQFTWYLLKITPVEKNGQIECWSGVCTDIHQLKTTQSMFQLVMDNIPISIFWKDRNSHYLGCNSQFSADVGSDTESIIGKSDYDNPSTKEESDFFVECDRRVMSSGTPEYHIIEPQLRPDGKQAWVDTSKIPLRDAGGEVFGVLGMYEDITARVTIEQQREDFIATLTHDLKNPLLGTNRVLDLLIGGKVSQEDCKKHKLLEQIKESNNSLILMIQNLLDVYRYDTVMRLPDQNAVNLNSLLKDAIRLNEFSAQAKRISLSADLPENHCVAEVNQQAVIRVVQNLLDNAIKFTPEDGSISVALRPAGSHYEIEIKDSGPGISPEEQKQLFNRFWQGTPGKKYSHGTGLGLYLCKQIVEAHRGTINCASSADKGAIFTISFPIKSMNP